MEIREFRLDELSDLQSRTYVCEFAGRWNPTALILEFSGQYGWAPEGNPAADFIAAIRGATLAICDVDAIVYDFREMAYECGNRSWIDLPHTLQDTLDYQLPTAMVISDKCRKGFAGCISPLPRAFESLKEALAFVEQPARDHMSDRLGDLE